MKLNLYNLCELVAKKAGITVDEIYSKSRRRHIVTARYCFFYLAHKNLGFGVTYLGKFMRNDHATVLHGLKCAKDHITTNWEPFTDLLNCCIQEITTKYQNDIKLTISAPFGCNLEEITEYLKGKGCRIMKFT